MFNSNTNWYYGIDGNPPSTKYDLISTVLHEIGHGLGFSRLCTLMKTLEVIMVLETNMLVHLTNILSIEINRT